MVTMAQRIEALRAERNLSRPALSAALGFPKNAAEKFETGRQTPSQDQQKKLDLPKILNEKGKKLGDGLIAAGQKYGFDLHVSGMPSLFYLRLADDPSLMLHQEWIAECVKRGVFFTTHHNHFINYALSDEDIAETVAVAEEAFSVIRQRHPKD